MNTEPVLLPLGPLVAEFVNEGAKVAAPSTQLVLRVGSSEIGHTLTLPQPPGPANDGAVALGVRATRQPFERRKAVAKIDGDGRSSDSYKVELRIAAERGMWKEVGAMHAEVRTLERGFAEAERMHYDDPAKIDPADAAGAALDAEARAYLRVLGPEERAQALRSDPRLLVAAKRMPLLAGVTSEHERARLERDWRAHRDSTDPATAQRLATTGEKIAWSRKAVNQAARALAIETRSDAASIVSGCDPVDVQRIADLVTIRAGERKFTLRADA